jgi:hypothetical protein
MSFLKSLFGGGKPDGPAAPAASEDYKGFTIEAAPYLEGGQYQLAGVIKKEIDGALREHRFVRADRFSSMDDAAQFTLVKGRQIIDQQGEKLFG